MNCEHALELMLEADPAELRRGDGDRGSSSRYPDDLGSAAESHSPLREHLATCQRCAAVAAALAIEVDQLARGIAAFADSGDADAAADEALTVGSAEMGSAARGAGAAFEPHRDRAPAAADGEAAGGREGGQTAFQGTGGWKGWMWAPIAAAAALAALLLARPSDFPHTGAEPGARTEAAVIETTEARFAVETPPGRNAAVMKTANPDITVVWLY
jgi:hypothetical protein